jgi:type VI protein secretion system component VasK
MHLDGIRIDDEELEVAQHRLAHVCHLLAEERAPYCPANGVLALIAWETTATQATTNRTAVLLDRDLQTINAELNIAAPRIVLVTDIETAVGGRDLVARIPADQRQRRFGVRFPRLSACDVGSWPRVLEEGVSWLTHELLPALAYRVLKTGGANGDETTWRGNANIFRFLNSVREREARLIRLLQRGMLPTLSQASLGGLYFSANSPDDPAQQAFLAGVMPQLLEMQNDVAWSPQAIAHDARARRWTIGGYLMLAGLIAGLIAIVVNV